MKFTVGTNDLGATTQGIQTRTLKVVPLKVPPGMHSYYGPCTTLRTFRKDPQTPRVQRSGSKVQPIEQPGAPLYPWDRSCLPFLG